MQTPGTDLQADSHEVARIAGLRYVTDAMPGIRRRKAGNGFVYVQPEGRVLRDKAELIRIRALAIPPAWENVWICPLADGHLQATGRDARGRKQHRYHAQWNEVRDQTKYDRLVPFARLLVRIRRRIERDLRRRGLPREKVLAAAVKLLDRTAIRVGNEEYARQNASFGLTTLRDRHVSVNGSNLRFEFRGKSGVVHCVDLNDRRLARVIRACQDLPGQELFQFIDDQGQRHAIDSSDVNHYLRQITGEDFTSKHFRTWAATVLAAQACRELSDYRSRAEAKRNINRAIELVAKRLGNTRAVCRKCYVHPAIIEAYLDRSLQRLLRPAPGVRETKRWCGLGTDELAVLALLQKRPIGTSVTCKRNRRPMSLASQLRSSIRMQKRPA